MMIFMKAKGTEVKMSNLLIRSDEGTLVVRETPDFRRL